MKKLHYYLLVFIALMTFGCEEDKNTEIPEEEELQITSFVFQNLDPVVEGVIDQENLTIDVKVPRGTDIKALEPAVTYNQDAELTPAPGYAYDFTNPLSFKLSKDDREVVYTVSVTFAKSDDNTLKGVSFPALFRDGTVTDDQIELDVPYGTDLSEVEVNFNLPAYAEVEPVSGSLINLENSAEVAVTAENGDVKTYIITVNELPQDVGVRAFWIPAPWHSPFLRSYEEIQKGVDLAVELNFNTLFVGTWAQTRILYPSQTLADNSSYNTPEDGLFYDYEGGSGDPLADLVEVAHANGLKVILWYEYGFMSRTATPPTPDNDKILAVHPDWVGINSYGQPCNYNESDYYYNAYNPEVQRFMLDMMLEAVNKYDVDGIQGDDRLPAMPRNSGYDAYTVARYKEEHNGEEPPSNFNNSAWVRWRADILNDFAVQMYEEIKAVDSECIIAFSPNPYPWAFNNLMQEWPVWLDDGVIEMLSVQCYRSSVTSYEYTIDEVLSYYTTHGHGNLELLSPGLILYGSSGLSDPEVLAGQILANRERGIYGESFFYDVPLNNEKIQAVIKAFYPAPAKYPELP